MCSCPGGVLLRHAAREDLPRLISGFVTDAGANMKAGASAFVSEMQELRLRRCHEHLVDALLAKLVASRAWLQEEVDAVRCLGCLSCAHGDASSSAIGLCGQALEPFSVATSG